MTEETTFRKLKKALIEMMRGYPEFGYFGKDFESYLRANISEYQERETEIDSSKIINSKGIAEQNPHFKPDFIDQIAEKLNLVK